MPDYIGWYATDLRLRLAGHMNPDRLDLTIREVESHLRESSQRLMEDADLSEEQASWDAVRAYGKPEDVALGYLREGERKIWGLRPIWVVFAGALIAMGCWDYNWISLHGFFDNFGETWMNGVATLLGLGGLVLFAKGCRAGYRSFRGPIVGLTASVAVGLVFFLSFWIVAPVSSSWQGFSRFHLSRDVEKAKATLVKLDRMKEYFMEGAEEFGRAKSASDVSPKFRDAGTAEAALGLSRDTLYWRFPGDPPGPHFFVPGSCFAMVSGHVYGVNSVDSFGGAKAGWAETSRYLPSIERAKEKMERLLGSAEEARAGRLFFFNRRVYGEAVEWVLIFLPILLTIDAAIYGIARRRSAWPKRALA